MMEKWRQQPKQNQKCPLKVLLLTDWYQWYAKKTTWGKKENWRQHNDDDDDTDIVTDETEAKTGKETKITPDIRYTNKENNKHLSF